MRRLLAIACALACMGGSCARAGDGAQPATRGAPPEHSGDTLPRVRLVRAFPRLTFERPVLVTNAGDDRLFVLEQSGRVRVFENRPDVEAAGVFLDISDRVRMRHNEEGLLALAFHPAYAANGHLYVYYSATPRRGVVARFTVDPQDRNRADPDSEHVILEIEQPYGNHNGASLLFGPDGYLYLSLGDGGWANDPDRQGQNLSTLLGAVLRIDVDREEEGRAYAIPTDNPFVDHEGARGEIWAYGLRNAWRMSFDRETGDLWAGDVGQNSWEEIDLIVKGGNYGWNIREGAHPFRNGTTVDPLIDPVVEYPQRRGREIIGQSVTGGYVYRGTRQPALAGIYIYGDYVSGRIWGLRYADGAVQDHAEIFSGDPRVYISSFGEDAGGELYLCSFDSLDGRGGGTGRVYRVEER